MSEKPKDNSISFRLNDEDYERLEILANSRDIAKSTMASQIIENVLNENNQEFVINHISYPRPVMKKIFTDLTEKQIILTIAHANKYNKEMIETAMRTCSQTKILNILKKQWKSYGCEIKNSTSNEKKTLEIHHELEKNWSLVTCASTCFILELLNKKIKHTSVYDDWFQIEYTQL